VIKIGPHTSSPNGGLEQFNPDIRNDVSSDAMHVRPGSVLVAVRNDNRMQHLLTAGTHVDLKVEYPHRFSPQGPQSTPS